MRYISTRGGAPAVGFLEAVLTSLAPDGGLYIPEKWPTFSEADFAAFARMSYPDLAADILGRFAGDAIDYMTLRRIAHDAYAPFTHAAVTPAEAARPRPVAAGAVPRPDPGVQGRGHAGAGAALRPRPGPAEPHRDHSGGHLGRHRRGGGGGVPRALQHPPGDRSILTAASRTCSACSSPRPRTTTSAPSPSTGCSTTARPS
ncbi:MAG: hypothetical protein WDM92_15470 [Caulobacteraceae bacterium]